MSFRLRRLFRVTCWLLILVTCCNIRGSAQNAPTTNASATSQATNLVGVVGGGMLSREEVKALTFGLDQIAILRDHNPLGIPLWQYVASALYFAIAFLVAKLLDFITRAYLRQWAEKTRTKFDDVLITLLDGPVKMIAFVILIHIGLQMLDWPPSVQIYIHKGLILMVGFSLTYLVVRFLDVLINQWKQRVATEMDKVFQDQFFPLIRKTTILFVVIIAVLITLQAMGAPVGTLIGSLGVGSLALALAAQDTVANLFGAVAVFLDKPFHVGDQIKVEAVEGVVEAIGLRSTRVRHPDGQLITVPNKTMGNAVITNISKRPNIKTTMNIGITYDTSTEKLKEALTILDTVYRQHPLTHDLVISFNQFADSSLNVQVTHWFNSTDPKMHLAGMQELNLEIKRRFDAAGINFAFPTRTVLVKQDSEWKVDSGSRNG
ncbi:MAG: mechanosensitive ion channel family protein [Pedosphaera sp.]|nr:mechanosensitive ion channel family protein [Pedosphaera sp.]